MAEIEHTTVPAGMDRAAILTRAALAYLAIPNAIIGIWGTVSPRGWYDDFPGFGRVWVAVDGPFNEHLVRDVASWALALAVLCVAAAVTLERRIVLVTGVAVAVQAIPHLAYHATNTEPYDETVDAVASLGGIALIVVIGVALAVWAARRPLSDG